MSEKKCPHCSSRRVMRTEEEKKNMTDRLRRVEGQIRGVIRMVDEDMYCPDILMQVAAARSALDSFSRILLADHIRGCVVEDIRDGKEETVDELAQLVQRLLK